MSARMYARCVELSLALLLTGACCAGVQAANPAPTPNDINMNDLTILEHRFFSHAYGHDPAEKRLERLECLVFGSTREGSNSERMTRLMKAVAARSQQPLAQEKAPAPPPQTEAEAPRGNATEAQKNATAKPPATSKQYPILNTLEWKMLKKTYPNESLDQRLDRLESKMFGQPAQTMAYIDRVERLKKTVGIGITPESADGITARGPMPKAQPRGGNEIGAMPPGFVLPQVNPLFGGGIDPFNDTVFDGMRQMQQLLQQQMGDLGKMPGLPNGGKGAPRSWSTTQSFVYDPETNRWVEQTPNKSKKAIPNSRPKATVPGEQPDDGNLKQVPGYADPNSI